MRKVVAYELVSVDGVAEDPGAWIGDEDLGFLDNLAAVIASQDDVLLGRGTWEYWVDYWPNSTFAPFAPFINSTPKHVFTSSPLDREWAGALEVSERAEDYVATMKRGDGGDIGLHGSLRLLNSLLAAGLVDELRLVVAPTIAGSGRRLFDNSLDLRRLRLIEAVQTGEGAMVLGYEALAGDT